MASRTGVGARGAHMQPLLSEGQLVPLHSTESEIDGKFENNECAGFEYIIAIRMPENIVKSEKGQEETKKFRKFIDTAYKGKSVREVLLDCIIDVNARKHAHIECKEEDGLEGALNCVIDIIYHLLRTIARSHGESIEILEFASIEKNKLFLVTRMSRELGEKLADRAEYPVQLSMEGVKSLGVKLFNEDAPAREKEACVPAWVKFDMANKDKIQLRSSRRRAAPAAAEQGVLRDMDRIRLLYNKITDYIDIPALTKIFMSKQITLKIFPAHNEFDIKDLREKWASLYHLCDWNQPIDDVQNYFGEKIAFQFLFYNFVRKALFVLGLLCAMMHLFYNSPLFARFSDKHGWQDVAQACVFLVWYLIFEKMWYRTEAFHANRWGADYTFHGSQMKDRRNPRFNGYAKPWKIDLNMTRLAPNSLKRRWGRFMAILVTMAIISVAFMCALLNRTFATWITEHTTTKVSVPSLLLAFQIHAFEEYWQFWLGPMLTKWEMHTYMHTLEGSVAEKYAIFMFFNKFQSFTWIAYVSPFLLGRFPTCPTTTGLVCVREILTRSLRTTYTALVTVYLFTMFIPRCYVLYKYHKQKQDLADRPKLDMYEIGMLEEQTKVKEHDARRSVKEYLRVISALAFVALFGAISPIIVVFAYLAVTFQHRIDAIQLCVNYQRVFPDRAQGIGYWNSVLKALRVMAIINTCALAAANPNMDFFLEIVAGTEGHATNHGSTTKHGSSSDVREVAFFHLLFAALLATYLVDALFSKKGARTVLESYRQEHQRETLSAGQACNKEDQVEIKGQCDWEASGHHKANQLKPGDALYRPRMQLVGSWL